MWELDRIKSEYRGLPEGVRRLWIATSIIWIVVYLVLSWEPLTFLWKGALATPQTTCAQAYPDNVHRRWACESAASGGRVDISDYLARKQTGASLPFNPYFNATREDEKLLIWLGTPIAWLVILWLVVWVKRGFKE